MYIKHQPDGTTKLLWCIYNLGRRFIRCTNRVVSYGVIRLQDKSEYILQLKPSTRNKTQVGPAQLVLTPFASTEERENGTVRRKIKAMSVGIHNKSDGTVLTNKSWGFERDFYSANDTYYHNIFNYTDSQLEKWKMDKCLAIQLHFKPIFVNPDDDKKGDKEQKGSKRSKKL